MFCSWKFNYRFDTALLVNLVDTLNREGETREFHDPYCIVVIEAEKDAYFFSHFKEIEAEFLAIIAAHDIQPIQALMNEIERLGSSETKKRILCSHQLYREFVKRQ